MQSLSTLSAHPESDTRIRGYCIDRLPGDGTQEEFNNWPVPPQQVDVVADFERNVQWLATRVQTIVSHWPVSTIECIKIGKTCVTKKIRSTFDVSDYKTWRYGDTRVTSPASRWNAYKKEGYHCLVVLCCFGRQHVPDGLRAMKMHQQHLALAYETALDASLTRSYRSSTLPTTERVPIAKGDLGGGGRVTLTQYKGGIVYVAIKLNLVETIASLSSISEEKLPLPSGHRVKKTRSPSSSSTNASSSSHVSRPQ